MKRKMQKTQFLERQQGGRCRFHAINNLIGRKLQYDEAAMIARFEEAYHLEGVVKAGFSPNTTTRETLVSYILRKVGGLASFHLPIGEASKELRAMGVFLEEILGDGYISYNRGHIHAVRKIGGRWYNCYSNLSRPTPITPPRDVPNSMGIIIFYSTEQQALPLIRAAQKFVALSSVDVYIRMSVLCAIVLLRFNFHPNHPRRMQFADLLWRYTHKPTALHARLICANFKHSIFLPFK